MPGRGGHQPLSGGASAGAARGCRPLRGYDDVTRLEHIADAVRRVERSTSSGREAFFEDVDVPDATLSTEVITTRWWSVIQRDPSRFIPARDRAMSGRATGSCPRSTTAAVSCLRTFIQPLGVGRIRDRVVASQPIEQHIVEVALAQSHAHQLVKLDDGSAKSSIGAVLDGVLYRLGP